MKKKFKTIGLIGKPKHLEATKTLVALHQFLIEHDYEVIVDSRVSHDLNLENVTALEESSAITMEQLYLDYIQKSKGILIIGKQNKNITGIMKQTKTSYILCNDRA